MSSFAGLRGTGSYGADERPKSFREAILWMNPNGVAPLFALTEKMKTESVADPEHSWWEEVNQPVRLQLNDGTDMLDSDTAVVVDNALDTADSGEYDALILRVGDVLQVEPATQPAAYTQAAQELVKVTAVSSATAFTIERGYAGTTAAAILDDAWFTRVGSSFAEGSGAAGTGYANPKKFVNYTQIFKKAFEETGTDSATLKRTGNAWENDKRRNMFQHAANIEQALLFGLANEDVSGSQPVRTMGGLSEMITSHRTIFAADPTIDSTIAALQGVFDYEANGAGNERLVYCGNGALNYLNKMIEGNTNTRINYAGKINIYGQTPKSFEIPQGTFAFKTHPLMNVHPRYTYSMFVVNPRGLTYRPLRGRDTKFEDNIQNNGEDKRKAQWLTECTFEMNFERTFAYIGEFKDFP